MARFELFGEDVAFGNFYQLADFKQKIGLVLLKIPDKRKFAEYFSFFVHQDKSYLKCESVILD